MRRLIIILAVLLLAPMISAGEISKYAKDSLDGFRGFLWGTPVEILDSAFDLIPIVDSSEDHFEGDKKGGPIDRLSEALLFLKQLVEGDFKAIWAEHLKQFKDADEEYRRAARETDYKILIDQIGEAEVDKCVLGFLEGKFWSVTIHTKGWDNWHRLYLAARERYAKRALVSRRINNEEQPNKYIDEFYWNSSRSTRMCKRNSVTNDGTLLLFSKVISKEALKADKEGAKKVKGDL